jgi:SAM-dependent methyltransferase
MTGTETKTGAKFRKLAESLAAQVEEKRRPRRENTPKQCREAAGVRIDADHLDRVRAALLRLADAHDRGDVPPALAAIRSKVELLDMLRTRIDTSGGYYSIRDTGEFGNWSDTAVELRAWLDAGAAPDPETARRRKVEEAERALKFLTIPGFFPTPPAVAARVVELADLRPGLAVLEPSAGKGDLAEAAAAAGAAVAVCETVPRLLDVLRLKGLEVVADDFLAFSPGAGATLFDRVMMNPPFERGQEIDHVRHAYGFLKPGGRLVSVMSTGPFYRTDRKAIEFRDWLDGVACEVEDLPADAFRDAFRSTGVPTRLVVIDKPASADPLDSPCKACGVPAGEKCKNYKGQNKQTCPDRGKPPAAPAETTSQPTLFGD